ncbi:uncharacterized protein LOC120357950 [Solenopsis invicta]|uniref:uncharacterized protein LOC120357950 n=1 Tax=Solenopsis invicta TaxID=13686 RepID=UPI00193D4D90|nr:uncharacterized protein LOC120357950 [Solenopsis invicta]
MSINKTFARDNTHSYNNSMPTQNNNSLHPVLQMIAQGTKPNVTESQYSASVHSKDELHKLSSTEHGFYSSAPSHNQLHYISAPHSAPPVFPSLPSQSYNFSNSTYNYPSTNFSLPSDQQHLNKIQKTDYSFFSNFSNCIDSGEYHHYSNDNLSMPVPTSTYESL